MRAQIVATGIIVVVVAGVAAAETRRFDFDGNAAGKAPEAFIVARTGQGEPAEWVVEAASDAPSGPNAVKQASTDATSYRFPLLVAVGVQTTDGRLSVRFKAISGRVDQAAGLVWRYRDANNYYIVRANALEDNVVLYKVEDGKRSSLAPKGTRAGTYGVDHEVPGGAWNTLAVSFQDSLFTVSFNGDELYQVEDTTFTGAGGVGLWTKADSVTLFDDLVLESEW